MNTQGILKVLAAVCLWGVTSATYAVQETWTKKAHIPTRRLGLSTSVVNGKIYAIGGGYSIEGPHSRIVEEYNPVTDTWTRKADMPTGRIGHAGSVVNGKIYVIGGDVRKEVSGSEVEEYDATTDTWTRKADMPTKRTFLCACTVEGRIYAIGGTTAPAMQTLSTMEVYDPMTDTWTGKADMPTPRSTASTSVVDGRIYAVGGAGIHERNLRTVEEYDPATDRWTGKTDMPTARMALCTSVVNGKIYAVGGAVYGAPPFSTVEEYDPITDTWTTRADMPTPRWFFSTSAVGGKIYAIGGAPGYPPHSSVSTVEEYSQAPLPPDFNGDGTIDGKDVLILSGHWGQDDPICDIAPSPFGDGLVDLQDLIALADYIGKEVNDPTLVAHWALDEVAGTVACDSAGENDGTILGVPLWQPEGGKVGGALEFDGTTFVVADSVLSPADGPFSALGWVQGGGPTQAVISQVGGANWLGTDASGMLMTELKSASRFGTPLFSDTVVTDGAWHRIGFIWDGATRSLYVDDALAAQDTDTGLANCHGGLNIGCGKEMTPDTFWSGLIDDVRICNRAVKPQ